jgi:hypothetical protein
MTAYINTPGNEVPDNHIVVVPHVVGGESYYTEVMEPLLGQSKREWFNEHFYFCLPLVTGNQYGFVVRSARSFVVEWAGGESGVQIDFIDGLDDTKQIISDHFKYGVITVQHRFALKTAPGINLMTLQPPNHFIDGISSMTGVVETDNIRRDFTFNLKVTRPNTCITVNIGDPLSAFIPIQRGTVEKYGLKDIRDIFSIEQHTLEVAESNQMGFERANIDPPKFHAIGRRYFKGEHSNGDKYKNHQKSLKSNIGNELQ